MSFPGKTKTPLEVVQKTQETVHINEKVLLETMQAREYDFVEALAQQLIITYRHCKEIGRDSLDKSLSDKIADGIKDALKITGAVATAGGLGFVASKAAGKGDQSTTAAAVFGTLGGLLALWGVEGEHKAVDNAKGFLALVEDIKDNDEQIKERMYAIANALCHRFQLGIQNLCSSAEGTEKLAFFFAEAIAKQTPFVPQRLDLKNKKLAPHEIVELVVNAAIIKDRKDSLYKKWFINKTLETDSKVENPWTISGLLLRSPAFDLHRKLFYVRDGKDPAWYRIKVKSPDRSDKYPLQVVSARPARYISAQTESMENIEKIAGKSPYALSVFSCVEANKDYLNAKKNHEMGLQQEQKTTKPVAKEPSKAQNCVSPESAFVCLTVVSFLMSKYSKELKDLEQVVKITVESSQQKTPEWKSEMEEKQPIAALLAEVHFMRKLKVDLQSASNREKKRQSVEKSAKRLQGNEDAKKMLNGLKGAVFWGTLGGAATYVAAKIIAKIPEKTLRDNKGMVVVVAVTVLLAGVGFGLNYREKRKSPESPSESSVDVIKTSPLAIKLSL